MPVVKISLGLPSLSPTMDIPLWKKNIRIREFLGGVGVGGVVFLLFSFVSYVKYFKLVEINLI